MNQKFAKYGSKIGVALLGALVIGSAYKAEKDTQQKINEKYDKKNDKESSDA